MKILTLQPPSPPYMNVKRDYAGGMGVADPTTRAGYGHDDGSITLPYMSLLYATALLERDGHDVTFIDAQADGINVEELISRLWNDIPDYIVCVINLPSIYGDLHIIHELKERLDNIKIIAIGTVCAPLYDEIEASAGMDVIVRGDPEAVICDIISALSAGKCPAGFEEHNGVIGNKEAVHMLELDSLPEMPYHLVPLEKYWYHGFGKNVRFAAVFSSRGCSFKCYYCPYPMGFGGCIVHRDPIKVVDEIETLQKKYGVKGVLFRDQVFSMDWKKTHKLCDEIIRRKLNLQWVIETRLDRVNEELLRKMKAAGCVRIHYGLESGDPKLFSRVGKDGAEGRMEELIKNFTLTEKIGIHPHMFMLIGLLGENWDTVQSTINTIQRIKPVTLQVAVVTPYPGTGLYDEIKKKGLLLSEDWSLYSGFKAVARTEDLSSDELIKARNMVIRAHGKAVFWKKMRQHIKLFKKYLFDGSVFRRLARHIRILILRLSQKMKLGFKLLMCRIINISGLTFTYRKFYNKKQGNRVRVLSAHRIIDANTELSDYDKLDLERGCLSLDEFEKRIIYLNKYYNFIRLKDYVAALKDGHELPENTIVLTFDDGFKDVIDSAYPVLKKYNIPFTLFVTTGMLNKDRMLSADDIRKLAKDNIVDFGAHTVTHRWLTNMGIEDAEKEISESKKEIERLVGTSGRSPVQLFCYPDGKFNDSIVALLNKHGFIGACSTGRGFDSGDDIMALKRIPFESEPFARFALRMAGWM